MRGLLVAVLLACALPSRAAPASDPLNWLGGPVAPQFFAYDLDDRGLPRYPFDSQDTFVNGASAQWWNRWARQFTEGSRTAAHLSSGLRFDGRLGAAFDWTHTDPDAFKSSKRSDLVTLHSTADLSRGDDLTLEYGFGVTVLWADRTYVGPSLAFSAEKRLSAPWTLYGRYAPALLSHTSPLQDLSGGIGANWRWFGAEVGYRALLNSLRHVYGPEVALRLWL